MSLFFVFLNLRLKYKKEMNLLQPIPYFIFDPNDYVFIKSV